MVDAKLVSEVDGAKDYTTLFRGVKRLVEKRTGKSRAGIMLGLAPLGLSPSGFLGGYFVLGSNAIVLNRDVLHYIQAREPSYHNAYAFHVLLHEYLHTLGWFREEEVRPMAYELSLDALGAEHPATRIAAAVNPHTEGAEGAPEFFKQLVYPQFGWAPPQRPVIEIVKGFDPDATGYIA